MSDELKEKYYQITIFWLIKEYVVKKNLKIG